MVPRSCAKARAPLANETRSVSPDGSAHETKRQLPYKVEKFAESTRENEAGTQDDDRRDNDAGQKRSRI